MTKKPTHAPHPTHPPPYGGGDDDELRQLHQSLKALSKFTRILERDVDNLIERVERIEATISHKTKGFPQVAAPQAPRSSPSEDHLFGLLHGWFNGEEVSGYHSFKVRDLANFLWRRLQDDPKALATAALGTEMP